MGIDVVERFHFFEVALHLSFRWILVLECALKELQPFVDLALVHVEATRCS